MNQEDLMASREVRRYLEKRAIDSTLAIVSVNNGYVTVAGNIRPLRSAPNADMQEELDLFTKTVMRNVKDVRSVTIDARIKLQAAKEKEEHHEQAGAHMPGQAARRHGK